jgi:hypothetical protein
VCDFGNAPQFYSIQHTEKAGANSLRPFKLCGHVCWGHSGLAASAGDYLRRGNGGYRAACITLKFTTSRSAADWKIEVWLTEEATPGVPLPEAASPVHLSRWQ